MAGKVEIKILKIRLVHMLHPNLRFLDPTEGPRNFSEELSSNDVQFYGMEGGPKLPQKWTC